MSKNTDIFGQQSKNTDIFGNSKTLLLILQIKMNTCYSKNCNSLVTGDLQVLVELSDSINNDFFNWNSIWVEKPEGKAECQYQLLFI